ncbi:MAG: DUF3552 domain-containing protein [Bdellovibrionales bacterium]|nr:DUF3552 domain-containing protein [Bdellovibrionales bacterium]
MSIMIYAIGALLGLLVVGTLVLLMRSFQIKAANEQAQDLVEEAQEKADELLSNAQREAEEFKEEKLSDYEKFSAPIEHDLEALKKEISEKESLLEQKLKSTYDRNHRFNKKVDFLTKNLNQNQDQLKKVITSRDTIRSRYENLLLEKLNSHRPEVIQNLKQQIVHDHKVFMTKKYQNLDSDLSHEMEKKAKRVIYTILNRFERPYSSERGINNINFSNEKVMRKVTGPENKHLALLEKLVGVDLTLYEERLFLNVSAFDPVRRELMRIIAEKLIKDPHVDEAHVKRITQLKTKELFKRIRQDGNKLANELGIKDFHPEVRNMLGSLRYRYSFSQNQYFHVGEVGWLCGLLCSELGLPIQDGRRAGVLHDIGKAMDHSIDGGHAVIGADFIDKHGEKQHIVHAVRAHHFDEQPSTDLAYLVIAADAISGARPGARRSTAETYSQKMGDLQRIGDSFTEVTNTYILSAGREIRLLVDSRKVSDMNALDLSKRVARKIEEELAFPGQIRVTVVRETSAVQYAK